VVRRYIEILHLFKFSLVLTIGGFE
jgi:hypothetical protein